MLHAKICGVVASRHGRRDQSSLRASRGLDSSTAFLSRPLPSGLHQRHPALRHRRRPADPGSSDQPRWRRELHHRAREQRRQSFASSSAALDQVHRPTFAFASSGFCHHQQAGVASSERRLQPRYKVALMLPRSLPRLLSFLYRRLLLRVGRAGIESPGPDRGVAATSSPFAGLFSSRDMPHIRDAIRTSFLIALLGFFESSVAARASAVERACRIAS